MTGAALVAARAGCCGNPTHGRYGGHTATWADEEPPATHDRCPRHSLLKSAQHTGYHSTTQPPYTESRGKRCCVCVDERERKEEWVVFKDVCVCVCE